METQSYRLEVLKALTKHLEDTVRLSNGYCHDLNDKVYRGRLVFSASSDPVPLVSILEDLDPDREPQRAGDSGLQHFERWTLLVQGWSVDDKDNPSDPAYELMADVKKALALVAYEPCNPTEEPHPNFLLGGLISGIEFEPGTVRPPDEPSSRAFFWMRVILKITENVSDPYRLT